jgi:hypothetical protein
LASSIADVLSFSGQVWAVMWPPVHFLSSLIFSCGMGLSMGCFQAVSAMVQQAMQYIDDTPDLDTRIELIETLNNVSAGKVGVLDSR